jgi:hypothetical protein
MGSSCEGVKKIKVVWKRVWVIHRRKIMNKRSGES